MAAFLRQRASGLASRTTSAKTLRLAGLRWASSKAPRTLTREPTLVAKSSLQVARKLAAEETLGESVRSKGGSPMDTTPLHERAAKARSCFAMSESQVKAALQVVSDYEDVLEACAQNVKMGPWEATSGAVLPYYLNASTNMLDKGVAHKIIRMCLDVLEARLPPGGGERLLVCGMEAAGGMMVCQMAAMAPLTHPQLLDSLDFVYIRKNRKKSGTCQQLEGPGFITGRTAESCPINAVWLDDANSTGSSLRDGVLLLAKDYNIHVHTAIYLVDRQEDRAELPVEEMGLADPCLDELELLAMYSLADIDAKAPKLHDN